VCASFPSFPTVVVSALIERPTPRHLLPIFGPNNPLLPTVASYRSAILGGSGANRIPPTDALPSLAEAVTSHSLLLQY
jgi:hypothetical protein